MVELWWFFTRYPKGDEMQLSQEKISETLEQWARRILSGALSKTQKELRRFDLPPGMRSLKKREVSRIRGALEKLDQGTYRNCGVCKKEINEERLRKRPSSLICVDCKQSFEDA